MAASEEQKEVVSVSHGNVYDHFSEYEEVCSIIDTLPQLLSDFRALEASQERLTSIVDKYQEQPHLLDPHLESIISKLFDLVRQEDIPPSLEHHAFKYLYLFSKARGAKVIIRWFSHEVSDIEPVLTLLAKQDTNDSNTWETRYILLLWLSIIVIIPFDLVRLDGSINHTHSRTVDRIMVLGRSYLSSSDKTQDAAALLCAKFLSRPDVQKLKMSEFLDWARSVLTGGNTHETCGVLKSLATLFKITQRKDVIECASMVLELVRGCGFSDSDNSLLRKLHIKLIQRLGTTFLPVRVLSWRYQRGNRSLEQTLASSVTTATVVTSNEKKEEEEEEEFDVPEEIEEILDVLLTGLKDKDTIVRWSSAKGIGRLVGRLPKDLADEVLKTLLDCFSYRETDSSWHGGCLALAELGRRGLLLPLRLPDVVPVVLKALLYDERKGSYSVGSHVRDAACYVCWSLARAYNPEQLKPYVQDIARGLIIVMIFDREGNCRKAASAAFQENVGRQGTFPHGIEILTMADYFAVGNISHTYLTLSVEVGKYEEYTHGLIDHLVEYKLLHWDSSLRERAAASLSSLTQLDPNYMKDKVLPQVISQVTSSDQYLRHGSLHAAAEVTYALSKICRNNDNQSIEEYFGPQLMESLVGVADRLVSGQVFKGLTGEIMRSAALTYIEKVCLSEVIISDHVLEVWQSIINDNLPHTVESIRELAVTTFGVVCKYQYCGNRLKMALVQDTLIPMYQKELTNQLHFARMGFALALGALPKQILEGKLDDVLKCLTVTISSIEGVPAVYCEARRDAIRALNNIFNTVDISLNGTGTHVLNEDSIDSIFSTLFIAMSDYSTDNRGDIAAIVREASMTALDSLCQRLSSLQEGSSFLKPQHVEETLSLIIQQSNEKIDRTRSLACSKLLSLIHHQPPIPNIAHHESLLQIFNSDAIKFINWSAVHSSFPFTVKLLDLSSYRYRTLLGLIISVGGLTESLVRSSSVNLLLYLSGKSKTELDSFIEVLLKIFDQHQKNTRVIVPLLKSLDLLLTNACFNLYVNDEGETSFPVLLSEKVKTELKGSRDPVKILSSINVYCGLLQFHVVRRSSFVQLMILLGHSFPKVRRMTGDQFYTTLIMYEDLLPDETITDQVMEILSETSWDGSLQTVREQRNKLCVLLGLPLLKSKESQQGSSSRSKKKTNDMMSYRDLVDRMGY